MKVTPVLLISCLLLTAVLPALPVIAHDRITTKVTWDREIAPIVQARCVSCHSPGGRAPMPLTTYEEARPWAKAIREEVLARRMPKWANARGWGDFSNDPSLSPFEIALMVAWADGGAPASAKDSTAANATVDKTADQPASRTDSLEGPSRNFQPARSRAVQLPCAARQLPAGQLVAVRPMLAKGESLRMTVVHPDGRIEPLLWIRNFDPAFAETYWLRHPIDVTQRTALGTDAPASCTVTALLAARTGK